MQDDRDGRAGDPGHRGAAADSADALPDVHVGHGDGHPEAGRVGVLEHERARAAGEEGGERRDAERAEHGLDEGRCGHDAEGVGAGDDVDERGDEDRDD